LPAILALGFGLRAYRVVEPLATPGDDARAYYALADSLYQEGSYGGPSFRDAGDWSPGAPLLYAAAFYATGGAREGTARIVELLLGLAAIVVVYLLGRRLNCRPAGLIARLRRRRLPAVHPLDRGPLQRAAGDLHPARSSPRIPLGRRLVTGPAR
jgi:asparagine N-glycosylation enzyme membrane subunit Stt3